MVSGGQIFSPSQLMYTRTIWCRASRNNPSWEGEYFYGSTAMAVVRSAYCLSLVRKFRPNCSCGFI